MRVLTIFFAFMLVLPVGIILSAEQASAMPSPRIWTFMVYGAGDNDLEKELIQDINEMELIGTTDEVNIVVQIDRWDGIDDGVYRKDLDDTTNGNWTGARRYWIKKDTDKNIINSTLMTDLGEVNMGDPSTLRSFVGWAKNHFVANKYCIVLWDHGYAGPSEPGVCWDWTSDPISHEERITPAELSTINFYTQVLGFDACLMAYEEMYYEVREAEIVVGSEEFIPGDGWPYHNNRTGEINGDILGRLTSNYHWTPTQFTTDIVDQYRTRYDGLAAVTLSAANMTIFNNLPVVIDSFAQALIDANVETYYSHIEVAIKNTEMYDGGDQMRDMYDFASLVKNGRNGEVPDAVVSDPQVQQTSQQVMDTINNCVIAEWHGYARPNSHGIGIYLPNTYPSFMAGYEDYYNNYHMPKDYRWDDFLKVFWTHYDTTSPDVIKNKDVYGWYNSDPGKVIDVDFDSGGNNKTYTLLDYAQYKIGETGTWRDIFTSNVQTNTDNWQISWSSCPEGENTIYIRCFDFAGNEATDSIIFKKDTSLPYPPTVSSSTHPEEDKWYNNNDPTFDWTPPSDLSGIQGYYYILDQKSNTIPTPSTGNWTTETNKTFYDKPNDEWHFHIISKDNASNVGTTADHYQILIDTLPPINSTIIINNNESQTSSPAVILNVDSNDIHLDKMQFSNGVFHSVYYPLNSPGSWGTYADDSESDHPYLNNRYDVWWINHTGGNDIMRVHFTKIDTTEKEYDPRGGWIKDVLYVKNQWQTYNEYFNKYENYLNEEGEWSKNVSGNKIKLVLDSSDGTDDPPRNGWGFKVDKYQVWEGHTYPNNHDENWTITHPGALMMKVHFTKIDTQAWHDYVYIYDKENNEIARYDGYLTNFWTPAVDGDTIKIRLVTDSSVRGYGFEIDKYAHFSHGSWSDWEDYNNDTKEWNLSSGDGNKAVYFRTKDTADNKARYVHDTITLETGAPTAVSLSDPSPITNNSMILQWTENTDYDFQRYELHKSDTYGFVPDETTLYRGLAARSWIEQKLTGLEPSTTYYYKVRVYDTLGNYNDSNEVYGMTTPSPVHLYNPTDIKSDSMILKWTRNNDVKFQKCQLHKSKTAGFTPSQSTLYKEDSDRTWIEEKIIGLESSTRYYFKVRVYDTIGQYIDSNEVNGRTMSGGSAGCPYVFVWNGPTCVKDNNILRGSQNLNRSQRDVIDYYKLEQDLVPKNGVYSMEIGEFENEYTNLNQLELMTIDHASDVNIAVTQDGVVLTYRDPMEPLSVIDRFGNDWLEAVNSTSGDYYEGYEGDYLVIYFGNPDTTFGAKLVLRADEKAWWGWHSRTEPRIWSSIKVQILNKTQQWENVGIIEPRDDWATEIVDLSPFISEMSNESFKIRLYWTQHHKLDYVGLDTSQQVDVSIQTYSISFALHSRFGDVTSQLVFQDENYTQILPADHISVAFPYVPGENETRDVVLVSKGYYYFVIDDIEVSQDVKVKLNVDGTVGNTVEMIILESSVSNRYHHLSVNSTIITVGESGNSVEATFKGYANRSYDILIRYITNGTGKNSVIIEVEFNDILEIKNINLDASEEAIQEMYIDINDDLNETLYELNGTIFTKTNATINMEPNNLIEENDIFDWENIEWNFGDGTSLTTTNRTVTHEYETPGTYIVTVTVTYDDGTTVTETKEVSVS